MGNEETNRTALVERQNALDKQLDLDEKKDILLYRKFWSPRIFWLILSILVFQGCLIVVIGLGWLKYLGYQSVVSIYLGESVVQIFGLGIIILKFLFPKNNR